MGPPWCAFCQITLTSCYSSFKTALSFVIFNWAPLAEKVVWSVRATVCLSVCLSVCLCATHERVHGYRPNMEARARDDPREVIKFRCWSDSRCEWSMITFPLSLSVRCVAFYESLVTFLPRDAMHKRSLCCHAVSVCPSVTFVDHVKTNKHIIPYARTALFTDL